jgi:hypothetical protein
VNGHAYVPFSITFRAHAAREVGVQGDRRSLGPARGSGPAGGRTSFLVFPCPVRLRSRPGHAARSTSPRPDGPSPFSIRAHPCPSVVQDPDRPTRLARFARPTGPLPVGRRGEIGWGRDRTVSVPRIGRPPREGDRSPAAERGSPPSPGSIGSWNHHPEPNDRAGPIAHLCRPRTRLAPARRSAAARCRSGRGRPPAVAAEGPRRSDRRPGRRGPDPRKGTDQSVSIRYVPVLGPGVERSSPELCARTTI